MYVEVNHGKATGHLTMGTHGLAGSGFSAQQELGNYVRLLAHLEVVEVYARHRCCCF